MLCFESNLTKREEEARDIMVYLFNPVLKFILLNSSKGEFEKYGFNSCRQTAIFGAAYLRKLLPEYDFRVYEGQFLEQECEVLTPYIHAFIIAISPDNRRLIIDISRTTKRLLFTKIYPNTYPNFGEYENVFKVWEKEINLDEMLNMEDREYLTGFRPKDLMSMIETLIEDIKVLPKEKQLQFCDIIYSNTTQLRR